MVSPFASRRAASASTPRSQGKTRSHMIMCFAFMLGTIWCVDALNIKAASAYYIRLMTPDKNGTMRPSAFLSAAKKAKTNDITVSVSMGALSQWELSAISGSSALTASSIGRSFARLPSNLAAVSCSSSSVITSVYASSDAAWTFEPVNMTGKVSSLHGPFYRVVFSQGNCGRKQASSRYLGVPKSCRGQSKPCAAQLLSGPNNKNADLLWELTTVKAAPGPTPANSESGLDFKGPQKFLFAQEAPLVTIRPSIGGEVRDFQVTFHQPNLKTTYFNDKPYRNTGVISTANFVKDFSWALGLPNAILSGQCKSPCKTVGQDVSAILLISSPEYNATTGLLTYAATKLPGWDAQLKDFLDLPKANNSNGLIFEISNAKIVIDSTEDVVADGVKDTAEESFFGFDAVVFGAQWLYNKIFKPTNLNQVLQAVNTNAAIIEADLNEAISQLTTVESQVTTILNTVQNAEYVGDAFTANQDMANYVSQSGPVSQQPIGTFLSCPSTINQADWVYNLVEGPNNIQQTLEWLYDAINPTPGTVSQEGLIPFLFNQAGQDCSSSNPSCSWPYTAASPSSPAGMVLTAMNSYVATQLQGLYLCQLVVNYTNNATNGCTALPQNYCTNPPPDLDATSYLNDIYTTITQYFQLSAMGAWPAYLWRNFDTSASATGGTMTIPLQATPGALLAGFQFVTAGYGEVDNVESYEMNDAIALNPLSVGSTGGYNWGAAYWISPTVPTGTAGVLFSYQFISLTPVILPAGYYALSANFITWDCPSFPGSTYYNYLYDYGKCKTQATSSSGPGGVLGIQILAAPVSFDSTGAMVFGETSTWSNAGLCSGSILGGTTTSTFDPSAASNSANAYYPPAFSYGAGTTAPDYQFLNLFSFTQDDTGNCQGPSGGWDWSMGLENSEAIPSPGFISGAALWLKQFTVSVGLIHLPYPAFNTSYDLATDSAVSLDTPSPPPPLSFYCLYFSAGDYELTHSGQISSEQACANTPGGLFEGSTYNGVTVSCGTCGCCGITGVPLPPAPPPPSPTSG